jgi:hypothetical protein
VYPALFLTWTASPPDATVDESVRVTFRQTDNDVLRGSRGDDASGHANRALPVWCSQPAVSTDDGQGYQQHQ